MLADYFTLSMSLSFRLSMLSELVADRIVIPFRIVTTSSVLRLVVKNVFKFAAFIASSTFARSGSLQVSHSPKFLSCCKVSLSLNLDVARMTPDINTKHLPYSFPVTNLVPPMKEFKDGM